MIEQKGQQKKEARGIVITALLVFLLCVFALASILGGLPAVKVLGTIVLGITAVISLLLCFGAIAVYLDS